MVGDDIFFGDDQCRGDTLIALLWLASKAVDKLAQRTVSEHAIRGGLRNPDFILKIAQHVIPRLSCNDMP